MHHDQPESEPEHRSDTPGSYLRNAREATSLTVAEVADKLHLKEYVVDILESDRYDELAGRTYARGYLTNYARLLGLSEFRVLELFDQYQGMTGKEHTLTPIEPVARLGRSRENAVWAWPVILVLLLGLIGYWLLDAPPQPEADDSGERPAAMVGQQSHPRTDPRLNQGENPAAEPSATPGPGLASQGLEAESVTGYSPLSPEWHPAFLTVSPPDETTGPLSPAVTEMDENAHPAAITATPTETGVPPPEKTEFRFQFLEDCWAEVIDATDTRHLYALYRAGSEVTVRALPPLRVTLGNAGGVRLYRNGQPVALDGQQLLEFSLD